MKFSSLLLICILLVFMPAQINATWIPYRQFTGSAPADTYLLNLQPDFLKITIQFFGFNSDNKILLFKDGTDTPLNEFSFFSNTIFPFYKQVTISSAGRYYLQITSLKERYQLTLETSQYKQTYYGNIQKLDFLSNPASLNSFSTDRDCQFRVTYNGPSEYNLSVLTSSLAQNQANASQKQISGSIEGGYVIIGVQHNLISVKHRTTFSIRVQTDSDNSCHEPCFDGQIQSQMFSCVLQDQFSIERCFPVDDRCIQPVFDCSTVENNAGLVDGKCTCQGPRTFNDATRKCESYCPSVQFNNNGLIVDNLCVCLGLRTFNPDIKKCQLDCSKVLNNDGPAIGYDNSCLCTPGLIFYHDIYECANPSRCSSQHLQNCICQSGWFFDTSSLQCTLYCSAIPNALIIPGVIDQCLCDQGYTWSSLIEECKPICGDGIKVQGEQCDDGNLIEKDGCSSKCKIQKPRK